MTIQQMNIINHSTVTLAMVLLNPNTIRYVCQGLYIIQTCVQSHDTLVINNLL